MYEATLSEAIAALGNQGLQGGWVISDNGDVLKSPFPAIQEAGAGWVRIGFRLGGCYTHELRNEIGHSKTEP